MPIPHATPPPETTATVVQSKKPPKARKATGSTKIIGRPTDYSQDLGDAICVWLESGKSLTSFCADPDAPSYSAIMLWRYKHKAFMEKYARAREHQGDHDADSVGDIRNMILNGSITPEQGRVAIDSLKWAAGKRNSKNYGDKLTHSNDPDAPIVPILNVTVKKE